MNLKRIAFALEFLRIWWLDGSTIYDNAR